jgi:BON domain-containing protein
LTCPRDLLYINALLAEVKVCYKANYDIYSSGCIPVAIRINDFPDALTYRLMIGNEDNKKVRRRFVSCTKNRKSIKGHLAIAAACVALLLVSGCQATKSGEPVKIPSTETPQDEALSKSVRDRLLTLKTEDLSAVKVVSNSGTVYLTGTVTSLNARQQAVKIAWTVPGVQSVINALEVQK